MITGTSIHEFNQAVCESSNDAFLNTYKITVEALVILFIVFFGIRGFIKEKETSARKGILSISSAVLLFFVIFALTDYLSVSSDYYEYGLYGLFVLPVFLALVVYSITAFKAFNVRLVGAQAPLLCGFLDALGIAHDENGTVEQLPPAPEKQKLAAAVDALVVKHDPAVVAVYLHTFQALHEDGGWSTLGELLQEDARLKI